MIGKGNGEDEDSASAVPTFGWWPSAASLGAGDGELAYGRRAWVQRLQAAFSNAVGGVFGGSADGGDGSNGIVHALELGGLPASKRAAAKPGHPTAKPGHPTVVAPSRHVDSPLAPPEIRTPSRCSTPNRSPTRRSSLSPRSPFSFISSPGRSEGKRWEALPADLGNGGPLDGDGIGNGFGQSGDDGEKDSCPPRPRLSPGVRRGGRLGDGPSVSSPRCLWGGKSLSRQAEQAPLGGGDEVWLDEEESADEKVLSDEEEDAIPLSELLSSLNCKQ